MSVIKAKFSHQDVKVVERQQLYKGFISVDQVKLSHRLFDGGWSEPFQREIMLRNQAVGILLYDCTAQQLVLVRQFRVGMLSEQQSPWLLEIVAGMVDEGEALEDVAVRESAEEANIEPDKLLRICDYYNSPGTTNEKITLYLGRVDASKAGGIYGLDNENEDIEVVVVPLVQAFDALENGNINNAMTIIALQWLQSRKGHIDKMWRT